MIPINDCKSIDLDKHALIEASAGTGKTYTIERLVVRMIIEKGVALENILLVTFTEKATGELKNRIREKIVDELKVVGSDDQARKRLRESLANFDSASIHTIHGFCQGALRDYSFENGQLFEFEVAGDGSLYENSLYEQMRNAWPEQYGDELPDFLQASGFPELNRRNGESQWIRRLLAVTKSYSRCLNARLLPEIPHNADWALIKRDINEQLLEISGIVGPIDGADPEGNAFYQAYTELDFNSRKRTSCLQKIVVPFLEFLCKFNVDKQFSLSAFADFLEKAVEYKNFNDLGFFALIPDKWNKGGSNLEDKCPRLEQMAATLQSIAETSKYILPVASIMRLVNDVAQFKKKEGLISFDDMLSYVAEAIDGDKGQILVDRMRAKYKYALVDEFQDTDSVQWKIFREIFLKGNDQRLFLIGDPKQAIYSFRGADVYTYLDARNEINKLAKHGAAAIYSLDTNYRSGPGLVESFNRLFGREPWFGMGAGSGEVSDNSISYSDVSFSKNSIDAIANDNGRAPMTIVSMSEKNGSLARKKMAAFIAFETASLINSGAVIKGSKDIKTRPVNYNDVCVLIRSKAEAELVEAAFDEMGIPHTYYKKPGIYQTIESLELLCLFRAIDSPNDESSLKKALLTPFFEVPLEELHKYENIPHDHNVKRLLYMWNEYALNKRWPCLFQSIIDESGLLLRQTQAPNGDRKLTNYTHILRNLENTAYEQTLDFAGIISALENWRYQTIEIEWEVDMHLVESEKPKVKIMTIHSSKGLEFPVLFLLGGFTKPMADQYYKYHQNNETIYDLAKDPDARELCEAEQAGEEKRLYYVALTRAKYRVYFPYYRPEKSAGRAGPISGFIYESVKAMNDSWSESESKNGLAVIEPDIDELPYEKCSPDKTGEQELTLPDPLLPPSNFDFKNRLIVIESFSAIHRKSKSHEQFETGVVHSVSYQDAGADKSYADDEAGRDAPKDDELQDKALPGGKHAGTMLHTIFEEIDFKLVDDAMNRGETYNFLVDHSETRELIEKTLAVNMISKGYVNEAARIVWHTLTTPVSRIDNGFALSSLSTEERIHELEFHYPFKFAADVQLPKGVTARNGYLTGFIDMIFRYNERYFIVDWKSNYIEEGYHQAGMERVMTSSDYHLQYKIYINALILWLKLRMGQGFDYNKNFGGVLYLFLRGMGNGNDQGVYFCRPEALARGAERKERKKEVIHS